MSDDGFGELRELIVDLERAPVRVQTEAAAMLKRGAQNMKTDWAQQWQGIRGMPAIGRAVSYDLHREGTAMEAEVGPDKDRKQGALGNIVEYGSSEHPPIRPVAGAVLAKELANLERVLPEIADPL